MPVEESVSSHPTAPKDATSHPSDESEDGDEYQSVSEGDYASARHSRGNSLAKLQTKRRSIHSTGAHIASHAGSSSAGEIVEEAESEPSSQPMPFGRDSKRLDIGEDVPSNAEDDVPTTQAPKESEASKRFSAAMAAHRQSLGPVEGPGISSYSHQQLAPKEDEDKEKIDKANEEDEWQTMPAYASYDLYDDDGKLIAKGVDGTEDEQTPYTGLGGAGKGYTRVQVDEDAQSATSMDESTAYLFKEPGANATEGEVEDDESMRDPLSQLQATKDLLTDNQKIAYVGVVRLAQDDMLSDLNKLERTKGTKKQLDIILGSLKMWSQKVMLSIYRHMELNAAEQLMIEQLAEHGLKASDLTPTLMANARVKNPAADQDDEERISSDKTKDMEPDGSVHERGSSSEDDRETLPPYEPHRNSNDSLPEVRTPSQMPISQHIDIDIRWTVLCDLFLVLISDAVYDARSRCLLERVGSFLDVPWLDICRFEKRVTDALEMEEAQQRETWDETDNIMAREKRARKRRLVYMGLATVGGGLIIGLSAGALAPFIGAGLAAGFTAIGVSGTSTFLAGAGGAAIIGTSSAVAGSTIGVKAAHRRTGAVKTFEYRPLHNNKRVNLIVTVAGWVTGKVDDVRLPFSTVDPIMGDIYSIHWEPEMLRSMGDTINILATEALTQTIQQVLGSTILMSLMAALQLPIVLSKLAYLIDNPWSVSLARADAAGLILADSLIDRNLGARPITLVGFSVGARVIHSCLKELSKRSAVGLIQNVYLFGSPVVVSKDDYTKVRAVVSGRFVNGYATNDWILGYLFRATGGGISRVAGLAKVNIPGIEDVDLTSLVKGHMAYRTAMPRLLREVGWAVESDEFTEIEDPDPENFEQRQRELINEIEEARKELENKPQKKKWGWFSSKKRGEKKAWETYDEGIKQGAEGTNHASSVDSNGRPVEFDIEAIRREAVELAAHGVNVKELETSMSTMKLNSAGERDSAESSRSDNLHPPGLLRPSRSYDGRSKSPSGRSAAPLSTKSYENEPQDDFTRSGEGTITMSFEPPARNQTPVSLSPVQGPPRKKTPEPAASSRGKPSPSFPPVRKDSQATVPSSKTSSLPFGSAAASSAPEKNVWANHEDDDLDGADHEMTMTFE